MFCLIRSSQKWSLQYYLQLPCVVTNHSVWSPVSSVWLCGHLSLSVITSFLCAVTHHSVQPPICPVGLTILMCAHWSYCVLNDLPCAVTNHSVRSLICSVLSLILACAHRSALRGVGPLCVVTDLPCTVSDHSVATQSYRSNNNTVNFIFANVKLNEMLSNPKTCFLYIWATIQKFCFDKNTSWCTKQTNSALDFAVLKNTSWYGLASSSAKLDSLENNHCSYRTHNFSNKNGISSTRLDLLFY